MLPGAYGAWIEIYWNDFEELKREKNELEMKKRKSKVIFLYFLEAGEGRKRVPRTSEVVFGRRNEETPRFSPVREDVDSSFEDFPYAPKRGNVNKQDNSFYTSMIILFLFNKFQKICSHVVN